MRRAGQRTRCYRFRESWGGGTAQPCSAAQIETGAFGKCLKLKTVWLPYRAHNAGIEGSSPSLSTRFKDLRCTRCGAYLDLYGFLTGLCSTAVASSFKGTGIGSPLLVRGVSGGGYWS